MWPGGSGGAARRRWGGVPNIPLRRTPAPGAVTPAGRPRRLPSLDVVAPVVVALVVVLGAAACASATGAAVSSPSSPPASPSVSSVSSAGEPDPAQSDATATGGRLQLIVEPGATMARIYSLLAAPRHTLDMTMYELVDTRAERILAADASRRVRVRVVLDSNRERNQNLAAYRYLNAHGVRAVWASSSYEATHEKAVVVDAGYTDASALIMTLNLTSRYYATTRDYAVIDHSRSDIAAIESVFAADYARHARAVTPDGADLVWSPGSEAALVDLIRSADTSVSVENEEMSDYQIVDALEADARRGVHTRVIMTADSDYDAELTGLAANGASVHLYPYSSSALYIHGKVIVVDAGTSHASAFVGSQNFSYASLDDNRELGIEITNPAIVAKLAATLDHDYAGGRRYT
jgi:cardiolipin synthase